MTEIQPLVKPTAELKTPSKPRVWIEWTDERGEAPKLQIIEACEGPVWDFIEEHNLRVVVLQESTDPNNPAPSNVHTSCVQAKAFMARGRISS